MPFVVALAQLDNIYRLVDIEFAAFRDEKVNQQLSYRDAENPEHVQRTVNAYKKYLLSSTPLFQDQRTLSLSDGTAGDDVPSTYVFRKVTDPMTGKIIAFAKTWTGALTLEDLRKPPDHGYEDEPEVNRKWMALNEKLHRDYVGLSRHAYFGMLATHPDHQHQGAATMLMDEIVEAADVAGVEIYLEATAKGRPLYEKYGFVPVHDIVFDAAEYGGHGIGVEKQTVMVRAALQERQYRYRVRTWDVAVAEAKVAVNLAAGR